jgi:hypothetical protein
VDAAVAAVAARKDVWAGLPIPERRRLLDQMVRDTMTVAQEWAATGALSKGLVPGTPAWGEEIAFGPMQVVRNLRLLDRTLASLERDGRVDLPGEPRTTPDGRIEVPVFPTDLIDRVAYAGHTGTVRLQEHVTDPAAVRAGAAYDRPHPGRVALVLGAGNASSLGPADVLTKLYAEHQVCVLKINPVNADVGPFLETAMQVLVREGFLRVVYGGVEVGQHLVDHPDGRHDPHDRLRQDLRGGGVRARGRGRDAQARPAAPHPRRRSPRSSAPSPRSSWCRGRGAPTTSPTRASSWPRC